MKSLEIIILVATSITLSAATILDCDYKSLNASSDDLYTCVSDDFETTRDDSLITEIFGVHINNKTDNDVKQLYVFNQSVPYFPGGLGSKFPNLESIVIKNSSLKFLFKSDLFGLSKLKFFDVSANEIVLIAPQLFENNEELEEIHFEDNKITSISDDLFDSLGILTTFHLFNNVCVEKDSDILTFLSSLTDIKKNLREKCPIKAEELTEISEKQIQKLMSQVQALEGKLREEKKVEETSNQVVDIGEDITDGRVQEIEILNRKVEKIEYEKTFLEISTNLSTQALESTKNELESLNVDFESLKNDNAQLETQLNETLNDLKLLEEKLESTIKEKDENISKLQADQRKILLQKKNAESMLNAIKNVNKDLRRKQTIEDANRTYYDRLEAKYNKENSTKTNLSYGKIKNISS